MTAAEFQHIVQDIPKLPGVYKFFDTNDVLIYVGKAKHLRKRVSSYFTKTLSSYKTHELVQRIARIEFTIVDSEQDAFLLENSLIKQFQPKYNISLKDDKTYPFLVIKNEPFPRIFFTRKKINDGSTYFGPYTSVRKVKELLEFIQQTIPLRNCTLNLTDKNIRQKKFKVCLEYHLGNCKGPCEGLQTKEDYQAGLDQIKHLLKGNLAPVIRHFKKEMKKEADQLHFEQAGFIKQKITFLENYQARSVVANARSINTDVFSFQQEKDIAYINFLMVRSGTIIQTHTTKVKTKLSEPPSEILAHTIVRLREDFQSDATAIVVPFPIDFPMDDIKINVPKSGDRKKLLELSEKNVGYFIRELKNKQLLKTSNKNADKQTLLSQLQKDLQLQNLPTHIECFDNSNFQGSFPVSAMVCFKNGVPSKKDYRHFNIKTVTGINDFASMKEAVYRRYKKLKEEKQPLPQLVIIDGGKGQLNAAVEAIKELDLFGKTTLIGLAKNIEEIFFTGDKESLRLGYDSQSLLFIRSVRDEVHRFGINFHRRQRSKGTFKNELENIKGIGQQTAIQLLSSFKSIKKLENLLAGQKGRTEVEQLIGPTKTKKLLHYFEERKNV